MDPITATAVGLAALAFLGGGKKKKNGNGRAPLPDVEEENGEKKKATFDPVEPDYKPGPIDVEKLDTYLTKLEKLFAPQPTANRFFQLSQGGLNASPLAAKVLGDAGINTGGNRVRLIKCMTQIPWNAALYTSSRPAPQSWGTLFNVNNTNLSAAWMPRNAPASQFLASGQMPPRTIGPGGDWLQQTMAYYGLVWIPRINHFQNELICDPMAEGPPKWLIDAIGGE